jgi:GNAT superfamily N-acetyltransferase
MLHEAEWIEAEAWADAAEAAPRWVRAALGVQTSRWGPTVVLRASRVDSLLFNRVFGLVGAGSQAPRLLEEAIRAYGEAEVARFLLHVTSADPSWTTLIRRHGLAPFRRPWVKLARGRSERVPALPCTLPIDTVRPAEAGDYGRVLAHGLEATDSAIPLFAATVGRPGWTTLVARDEGTIVGVAALFVRDGIASLAGAATVPSHRRRGIQGALMVRRIRMALDLGCTVIAGETGVAVSGQPNSSCNNMLRCGLDVVGTIRNFAPPETSWAAHRRPPA